MMALYFLFLPTVCAAMAGTVIWTTNRSQVLDDNRLIRQFILWFAICIALAWGLTKTDAVRLRIDPQFRLMTEMQAHPLYVAIKRGTPDDLKKLEIFLAQQVSQGRKLDAAFVQARPLLTDMAGRWLGYADSKTTLMWARLTVESLKELHAQDPLLCYQALSLKPSTQQPQKRPQTQPQRPSFSADNSNAFQRAVVEVYESAGRGLHHQHPPSDQPPDFNEVSLEYRTIMEVIAQRFGQPMAELLTKKAFIEAPAEPAEKVCAAMIFQLEAMQARPPAMAVRLLLSNNSGLTD